jgi:hypothetical protein
MTTSTKAAARKVTSPFAGNPKRFCDKCRLERTPMEQRDETLKGMCQNCAAPRTQKPSIHEGVRVCGNCDVNISSLPADALFCGQVCRDAIMTHADTPAALVTAPSEPAEDVKAAALAIAVEMVRFQLPNLTEYEAESGLKAAIRYYRDGRVSGKGVAAAARVWFHDAETAMRNNNLHPIAQGAVLNAAQARNTTRALRILKPAIRAAREYVLAHASV